MKRLPCLPELARAIREDRKTETRRLITPQPFDVDAAHIIGPDGKVHYRRPWGHPDIGEAHRTQGYSVTTGRDYLARTARYKVGEVVGIAEPWALPWLCNPLSGAETLEAALKTAIPHYMADGPKPNTYGRVRLARFLPDAFVRTRIEILTATAERLQDITEAQCRVEGLTPTPGAPEGEEYLATFKNIWDRLHPDHPWTANPYVWRYTFRRVKA